MSEKLCQIDSKDSEGKQDTPCVSEKLFESMKTSLVKNLSEDDKASYQKFGEKFHKMLETMSFETEGRNEICMEESLSYIVESLKSGLHPRYLSLDEQKLVEAGYGEKWFQKWGYESLE
jgi:hypothetical protein